MKHTCNCHHNNTQHHCTHDGKGHVPQLHITFSKTLFLGSHTSLQFCLWTPSQSLYGNISCCTWLSPQPWHGHSTSSGECISVNALLSHLSHLSHLYPSFISFSSCVGHSELKINVNNTIKMRNMSFMRKKKRRNIPIFCNQKKNRHIPLGVVLKQGNLHEKG